MTSTYKAFNAKKKMPCLYPSFFMHSVRIFSTLYLLSNTVETVYRANRLFNQFRPKKRSYLFLINSSLIRAAHRLLEQSDELGDFFGEHFEHRSGLEGSKVFFSFYFIFISIFILWTRRKTTEALYLGQAITPTCFRRYKDIAVCLKYLTEI